MQQIAAEKGNGSSARKQRAVLSLLRGARYTLLLHSLAQTLVRREGNKLTLTVATSGPSPISAIEVLSRSSDH